MSFFRPRTVRIFKLYLRECSTVAGIMGLSDVAAQLVEKRKKWDKFRTLRFSTLGFVVVGPIIKTWFIVLDKIVSKKHMPFQRAIRKMLLDQLLFSPPFIFFLTVLIPYINGVPVDIIKQDLTAKYISILRTGYLLWPIAQIINFTFVPMTYQITYVQVVAIIWNTILSIKLNYK